MTPILPPNKRALRRFLPDENRIQSMKRSLLLTVSFTPTQSKETFLRKEHTQEVYP